VEITSPQLIKPEMEFFFTTVPMENSFNDKYLKNGEKYDSQLNRGQPMGYRLAL